MGALSGVEILDFTTLLPGPYATLMLADMGAQVLTVSSRERYDLVARLNPTFRVRISAPTRRGWGAIKKPCSLTLSMPRANR